MSESKETKEITIFPTITSLLKPTTDYLAEELKETVKAKVVYLKKNAWNVETLTFYRWPVELNGIIFVHDIVILVDVSSC